MGQGLTKERAYTMCWYSALSRGPVHDPCLLVDVGVTVSILIVGFLTCLLWTGYNLDRLGNS